MAQLKSFSSHLWSATVSQKLTSVFADMKKDIPPYIDVLLNSQQLQPAYDRAQELKAQFSQMAVVGIGGSHLGAESFLKALSFPRNVTFMENPDPVGIARRFSSLGDISKTHFVFVSKSGSTYETLAIANWILDQLQENHLSPQSHCTVITIDEECSALKVWAQEQGVHLLEARKDLSGRFSVLSPAGLLPIYFSLDIKLEAPLESALAAFHEEADLIKYATLLYSSIAKQYRVLNFWSYADQMLSFSKWWRQLWSESLGHKLSGGMKFIPTCVLCRGASDQHSYLQQVIDQSQSQLNIVLTVSQTPDEFKHLKTTKDHFKSSWNLSDSHLEVLFKRESLGLIKTFSDLEIPYLHLEINDISLEHLSYFVIQQQLAIALIGHALGLDPYVQPAVEEMKLRVKELSATAEYD